MTHDEAVRFLRPAVPRGAYRWADLGAGSGVFTDAVAQLLGPDGSVIAVERDRTALDQLRRLAARRPADSARVTVAEGDLRDLASIPLLADVMLDGALFGNVLHYFPDPSPLLAATVARLSPTGRLVVVEYANAAPNRWVPHPVSTERLTELAVEHALDAPRLIAQRPSRYQRGALYCAVLERAEGT